MLNVAGNSVVIPPTIGRIVLFRHSETKTFPAIITGVLQPIDPLQGWRINLMVFTSFVCEAFTSVEQGEEVGQWDWMKYTKEQELKFSQL